MANQEVAVDAKCQSLLTFSGYLIAPHCFVCFSDQPKVIDIITIPIL